MDEEIILLLGAIHFVGQTLRPEGEQGVFQFAVLSFNHPEITSRCLNSLLPFGYPILLVHNGSEKKHVTGLQKNFPQVTHLVLPQNIGFAAGANTAIENCSTDWIYFLTNDTELMSVAKIPAQPGLYGPWLYRKDKKTLESCGGIYNLKTGQIFHQKNPGETKLSEIFYIPGHSFLIHRSVFLKFDIQFYTYLEDVDLCIRLHKQNIGMEVLPDFKVAHLGGKTCRKDRKYSGFYFQRNRLLLIKKYSPSPLFSKALWLWQLLKRVIYFIYVKDRVGLKYSHLLVKEIFVAPTFR